MLGDVSHLYSFVLTVASLHPASAVSYGCRVSPVRYNAASRFL